MKSALIRRREGPRAIVPRRDLPSASRSGYTAWRTVPPPSRAKADEGLLQAIRHTPFLSTNTV